MSVTKRKKRTAICINAVSLPGYLTGVGTYTHELLKTLVHQCPEWEFSLLINKKAAPYFRDIPNIKRIEVSVPFRILRWLYLVFVFPWRTSRFALIHSVHNIGFLFCDSAQVITIHDCYEHVSRHRYSRLKCWFTQVFIAMSSRKAAHIITISKNSKVDLERYYPHVAGKLSVIYSGCKYPARRHLNENARADFLFVGTLEPGKNLGCALEAFSRFHKKHGGLLHVVGSKGWKEEPGLAERLRSLELGDALRFWGGASDEKLLELYRSCLALLQTSVYEGFGLPVIEAMNCGCPVIAARNSGLIEAGGDSALFFETNDVERLAELMEDVYSSEDIRKECIRSGYVHASRFTWEQAGRETADIFRRSLQSD